MITAKELNPHGLPTTPAVEKNLAILLQRMNEIRGAWGHPMIITSGLRSDEQQLELKKLGKTSAGVGSKHCAGAACDVFDPDQALQKWILADPGILSRIGLWCEDFKFTHNWVHFQIMAPASGKRFFIP